MFETKRWLFWSVLVVVMGVSVACEEDDKDTDTNVDTNTETSMDTGTTTDEAAAEILGNWTDAFATTHTVSETSWTQASSYGTSVFNIETIDKDADFLVAQNDAANAFNPNLWSRMDWTVSAGDVYFCQIVFDATTKEAAAAVTTANRADLTGTGCGGFAWSLLTSQP